MSPIQKESIRRGITRLCHFTQSRNLAHILADSLGICSTKTLRNNDMPYNPTDPSRYDGRDDLICCSIEHPNTYYFDRVRNKEPLFKDWVILYIDPKYLWDKNTHFCPRNAAADSGQHIAQGYRAFVGLFSGEIMGAGGMTFTRSQMHLMAAPTDIQAEVLISDPIPLESIIAIVVQNVGQAQNETCRLNLQGIIIDKPIYVVPDFFNRATLSSLIQSGIRVTETLYNDGGHNDQ